MMREDLIIMFKPGEIWVSDKDGPISIHKCPNELQDDVYFYLLGTLSEEIRKGIAGSKILKEEEAKEAPSQE